MSIQSLKWYDRFIIIIVDKFHKWQILVLATCEICNTNPQLFSPELTRVNKLDLVEIVINLRKFKKMINDLFKIIFNRYKNKFRKMVNALFSRIISDF